MKNKGDSNTILDIVMFLVMLAIFCIKSDLHETLAYTIGGLVILHLVLHWKQFIAMLKKNIGNNNIILDIVMFLVMLAIYFIKGDLHETLAYTIGGLLILHIVLHWQQFQVMYRRLIPEVRYQQLVAIFTGVLVVVILTMPLYMKVDGPGQNGGPPDRNYTERGRH